MKLHPPIVLYIMRTLVDSFHKIVRHHCWIQRLGVLLALLLIMLAFLAMVQQWRGPKMWSHRVQQAEHIHYHGSIPNAHNQYIRIFRIFRIHSSRLFNCTCSYVQITIECLFCYCCHNCNRPQSALCSEGFNNTQQWKSSENGEGLGTLITWMTSDECKVDIGREGSTFKEYTSLHPRALHR